MITYFVRQFLEGGTIARAAALPRRVATATCHTRPARGNPQPRAGSNAVFPYWNCRVRLRAACFSASRVAALKTRLENDPAVSERVILVWGRSMRPAEPICAFDHRLSNAPEWARAGGF
jgi:hypothetical protein